MSFWMRQTQIGNALVDEISTDNLVEFWSQANGGVYGIQNLYMTDPAITADYLFNGAANSKITNYTLQAYNPGVMDWQGGASMTGTTFRRNLSAFSEPFKYGAIRVGEFNTNNLGAGYSDPQSTLVSGYTTWATSAFKDPLTWGRRGTPIEVADALEAKVGGPLDLGGGKFIGPFAPKGSRKIDHRRRTWDASILSA